MKEDKEPELRELFLTNFIEAIIESFPEGETQEKVVEKVEIAAPSVRAIPPVHLTEIIPKQIGLQQLKFGVEETQTKQGMAPSLIPPQTTEQFPIAGRQPKLPIKLATFIPQNQRLLPPIQGMSLTRISSLLRDPTITNIECSGPEKNIVIRQLGKTKVIPLILTEKEINDIMQEFSVRTKIPLIGGVFKAAIDNFVVSAVISEFVGTRFYIEKIPQINAPFPQQRIF